jgi:hypothetical protein
MTHTSIRPTGPIARGPDRTAIRAYRTTESLSVVSAVFLPREPARLYSLLRAARRASFRGSPDIGRHVAILRALRDPSHTTLKS